MRAITVQQPFASAILAREKNVENRSFFPKLGDILICAGKHGDPSDGFPRGVALCVARISGFVYDTQDGETICECPDLQDGEIIYIEGYQPGNIGWLLSDIRPVKPIPVRGKPGIFNVDDNIIIVMTPTASR